MTWMRKSETTASSRVALKASTNRWGRLRMKPTVSVMRISCPPARVRRRVVGSRVAKSLFSARTSAPVSLLRREDLPALV